MSNLNHDFIRAIGERPVSQRPNGVFCFEAEGNTGRVLAAVRECRFVDWHEKMRVFTWPRIVEVTTVPMPPICEIADCVARRAKLTQLWEAKAFYRRTKSGYIFLWMGGLDFFLAKNPEGSRHSFHRYWLGDAKFPQKRREKKDKPPTDEWVL